MVHTGEEVEGAGEGAAGAGEGLAGVGDCWQAAQNQHGSITPVEQRTRRCRGGQLHAC